MCIYETHTKSFVTSKADQFIFFFCIVKKGSRVSRPQPGCHYQLSLGGNNDVITELFLPRGSLFSDIPAGDGKLVNLFLRCDLKIISPEKTVHPIYVFFVNENTKVHLLQIIEYHLSV